MVDSESHTTNHTSPITNGPPLWREIRESRLLTQEREPHDAGRAVALLGDDEFRGPGVRVLGSRL